MRQYIFNFNWLALDRIIRIVGGLFVGVWVARYLGPERFGLLGYATALVSFLSFLSTLGLNSILVRELTSRSASEEELLGTAFYLKLYGAIAAIILGSAMITIISPQDNTIRLIVLLMLVGYAFQSMDVVDYYYQAKVISRYAVAARALAFILTSGIKIYFIFLQMDVIWFGLAYLVELILTAIFLYLTYRFLDYPILKWRFNYKLAKAMLSSSWPLMISSLFITMYIKIDQVMIEHYLDLHNVGLFSASVRLSEVWYFIPAVIVNTLTPYFVGLRDRNRDLYILRLRQLYTFMFWIGVCVGLFTTLYGQQIVTLIFGSEYKDSYQALSINIWAGIFVSISFASSLWMLTENLTIYSLYGTGFSLIVNILANFILIPEYGIAGAAFATFLTQLLGVWAFPLLFVKLRSFTLLSITSIIPVHLVRNK